MNRFPIRILSVKSGTAVLVVRNPTVSASIRLKMMNSTSKQILDLYQFN